MVDISREPGLIEKYFIQRNVGGYYTNVNISAKYNKRLDRKLISNALRLLILKHSIFAVNFFKQVGSNSYLLKLLEKINFETVFSEQLIDKFDQDLLTKLLDRKFPYNLSLAPTWAVKLFNCKNGDQHLTFYCDHALFDGMSLANFHVEFIKQLQAIEDKTEVQELNILFELEQDIDHVEIMPSSDKLVNLFEFLTLFAIRKITWELIVPGWFKKLYNHHFVKNYPNIYKYPLYTNGLSKVEASKVQWLHIPKEQTSKLVASCKKNSVMVTSCMAAIIAKAIRQRIASDKSSLVDIDLNGRRYFKDRKSETLFGIYVSLVNFVLSPDDPNLITTSQRISEKIEDSLESKEGFSSVGLLKWVDPNLFLEGKLNKLDSRTTFEISNLGNFNVRAGNWTVEDLVFSQPNGLSTHFCFSVISSSLNGINICLSHLESKGLQDEVEELCNDVLNSISDLN